MADRICPELVKNHLSLYEIGIRDVKGKTFITSQKAIDVCLKCPYEECYFLLPKKVFQAIANETR